MSRQRLINRREVGKDKLGLDRIDVARWVDGVIDMNNVIILESPHDLYDSGTFTNVAQEFVAKPSPFGGAFDDAGDIGEANGGGDSLLGTNDFSKAFESAIGKWHDADIWLDGGKWIVGCQDVRFGEGIKES